MVLSKSGSSPLMRGIRRDFVLYAGSFGIIPAHAGNTAKNDPPERDQEDHPRSCGEYVAEMFGYSSEEGSSPLMRGIHEKTTKKVNKKRIIPAHAGNTIQELSTFFRLRDHPRSCGEYSLAVSLSSRSLGSSPLMRGIRDMAHIFTSKARIIPAHAGNTYIVVFLELRCEDHPRSCGEYYLFRNLLLLSAGSSPLMRGIPFRRLPIDRRLRIIPAHAGNTAVLCKITSQSQDHPRSCGEYLRIRLSYRSRKGSSPLMRGIRNCDYARCRCCRIIPAHAGNTQRFRFCFRHSKDHPRSCGEYNSIYRPFSQNRGSSPLMRGIQMTKP